MVRLILICTFLAYLFCIKFNCLSVAKDVIIVVFSPIIIFKGIHLLKNKYIEKSVSHGR